MEDHNAYDFFRRNGSQNYKKKYLKIAKELHHPQEVLDRINKAKSEDEVSSIMYVAMKNMGEN